MQLNHRPLDWQSGALLRDHTGDVIYGMAISD